MVEIDQHNKNWLPVFCSGSVKGEMGEDVATMRMEL